MNQAVVYKGNGRIGKRLKKGERRMINPLCDTLGLTNLEWEILEHRLSAPNSIAEALDGMSHPDDVEYLCEILLRGDLRSAADYCERGTALILIDCVEGSTYFGSIDDNESPSVCKRARKAGLSLAEKIGEYVEREVVPALF